MLVMPYFLVTGYQQGMLTEFKVLTANTDGRSHVYGVLFRMVALNNLMVAPASRFDGSKVSYLNLCVLLRPNQTTIFR